MSMHNKDYQSGTFTRRKFLKTVGTTSAVIGTAAMVPALAQKALAAERDHILIGQPAPLTGPLAGLGESSAWIIEKAVAAINAQGGISIQEYGKKLPVQVQLVDLESDAVTAAKVTSKLILQDKVDLILALYTPETVNSVCLICEKYKTPCLSMGVPVESWLSAGPYTWSYNAFWTVDSLSDLYISAWDDIADQTNRVVGGLWPDDPSGLAYSEIFTRKLTEKGYTVVDPGRFSPRTRDFSKIIRLFKQEQVEILTGTLPPPVWAIAWRQCRQQGLHPKMATIAKAILFPSAVEALGGDLGQGLTTEVWWNASHPFTSSLTGETATALCDEWTSATGKQWIAPLGFDHAVYEIAYDVLKRAGTLNKQGIRDAIAQTDLDTIVGHITYDQRHACETPLVLGQWVKGQTYPWEIQTVSNRLYPEISTTAEMIFPLSR